jgi:hypothetical protein
MGIDWSVKKHDFAILNDAGAVIAQAVIPHQKSGFRQLDETREALAVPAAECLVPLYHIRHCSGLKNGRFSNFGKRPVLPVTNGIIIRLAYLIQLKSSFKHNNLIWGM